MSVFVYVRLIFGEVDVGVGFLSYFRPLTFTRVEDQVYCLEIWVACKYLVLLFELFEQHIEDVDQHGFF